jgi:hypothetical protein
MVGGGGINSPTHQTSCYQGLLRMGAPDSLVLHRCANGHFQRLVLIASRWADGTPDSEQSLSGVSAKIPFFATRCSWVSAGRGSSLGQTGPTVRGHTGQSGAPKTETLGSISF